eukprot:1311007-Heterocapsa_arctica.AAC.1
MAIIPGSYIHEDASHASGRMSGTSSRVLKTSSDGSQNTVALTMCTDQARWSTNVGFAEQGGWSTVSPHRRSPC